MNPDLATELEYFRLLRRQRIITKREFEREKKKILDRQDVLDMQERSRRLQAEFTRREAERKARKAEITLRRKIRRDLIFDGVCDDSPTQFLRGAYQRIGTHQRIRIVTTGEQTELNLDLVLQKPTSVEAFIKMFFVYEGGIFIEYMSRGTRLMIFKPSIIPVVKLRQMFRDGIEHCVFVPILKKLNDAMAGSKSTESKKRYAQRIAKIQDLEELYVNGVPEDKMEDVAKASGYKIIIHNILGKEIMTFNENGKVGVIKFTNTRPNHIEYGHLTLDQDYEQVSEQEIIRIWKTAMKNRDFYMIEGDIKNDCPRRLRLLDKAYRVVDPNESYFNEMNERIDLNKYRFNASKYPEVNEFIKDGRIINAWVCPFTDEKPTGHLDMPKAYTQFKNCSYYSGFLGVIHQWRSGVFDREFISKHIGMYQVSMKTTDPLLNKLGIGNGTTLILPSPEILYFMDQGVECVITAGVWGSRMDFEFEDDMLSDRRYCLWSGRLGMERTTRNFSFSSSAEWASHLVSEFGDDCFYWSDHRICSVRVPVKNVLTTHHILAFITSYVRIQMIEAMKKFEVNQLVKVVMDGIYFVGETPMGLEWFREKDIKENSRAGFAWYNDLICNYDFPKMIVSENTLLTGQGGAGKTHLIMTDSGFNRILFVSPQHILGADVREKYGAPYTTIHKLIGEECQPYHLDHPYPSVIFIDEVTQISADWIDKALKMYKDSLVILAGDLSASGQWFQCRNGYPGQFSQVWKPSIPVKFIEGDRRSRDDELKALKIRIRSIMEKHFVSGDAGEEIVMKLWAKKYFNLVKFDDAVKMFGEGDRWIAGTHRTSNKLLENGVCSGWYRPGGFVSFEEKEGYEKRGSFTIHSFQGRTLETGKIFISVGDLFEYAMLYTAVSRAVHFNQLVFVE